MFSLKIKFEIGFKYYLITRVKMTFQEAFQCRSQVQTMRELYAIRDGVAE